MKLNIFDIKGRLRELMAGHERFIAKENSFQWITKIFGNPKPVFLRFQKFHCMGFFLFIMIEYNKDREESLLVEIRPVVLTERFDSNTEIENFQNETLRPILKMQHNVLIDFLLSQPNVKQIVEDKQVRTTFENQLKAFINQAQLKGIFIGMIVGCMTRDELVTYNNLQKEYNKRIIQMLLKRFCDSI